MDHPPGPLSWIQKLHPLLLSSRFSCVATLGSFFASLFLVGLFPNFFERLTSMTCWMSSLPSQSTTSWLGSFDWSKLVQAGPSYSPEGCSGASWLHRADFLSPLVDFFLCQASHCLDSKKRLTSCQTNRHLNYSCVGYLQELYFVCVSQLKAACDYSTRQSYLKLRLHL